MTKTTKTMVLRNSLGHTRTVEVFDAGAAWDAHLDDMAEPCTCDMTGVDECPRYHDEVK